MNWDNKTIVIAEDEETNFLLLVEYLEPTNAKIVRVVNGVQLVEYCKSKKYDLILLDLKMPLMTGFEAVRKIRDFNLDVPVIAQTAYAMVGDREKAILAGCNEYLSKPIAEADLLSKISKYFG
jgi:CheY-like chemotaxis protein